MKGISFVSLVLILILLLCGCGSETINGTISTSTDTLQLASNENENEQTIATERIIERASKESLKNIKPKSYSLEDLLKYIKFNSADNFSTMINELDEKFPIECIRVFDDSLTYSIYSVDEGGLLYVFYHGDIGYKFANYVFYADELLNRKDFNTLKKGYTIASVEAIDSGFKKLNSVTSDGLNSRRSIHLVKGGFMEIEYTSESEDISNFKVDSVKFISNGDYIARNKYYILEQDLAELN